MQLTNSVVFHQDGKFAGWPANAGMWAWDNEILVSYVIGDFVDSRDRHSIDFDGKFQYGYARSLDGGMTWENSVRTEMNGIKPVPEGGFHFSHPDFCLQVGHPSVRITGHDFCVSYDRGHTWTGPYLLPDFSMELSCRTRYLIEDDRSMLLFMSHITTPDDNHYRDRAFVAESKDGGCTWGFSGFMTDDHPRSVMPDVVRLDNGDLVAVLRRKFPVYDDGQKDKVVSETCYIECRISKDNGKGWEPTGIVAYTGNSNGNPPALSQLPDGRLVCVYGRRKKYADTGNLLLLNISYDNGATWQDERVVRSDITTFDFGYPQATALSDGRILIVYYIRNSLFGENYIASSIVSFDD